VSAIEITSLVGLAAVYLLAVNVMLGLLMSARYNPWTRWPHRRINLLKLHNWTAYAVLALSLAHPVPLLFVAKPRFTVRDIVYPVHSPEQPLINTLGAIALYLLIVTVVTSYFRAAIGRQRWKTLHYLTYVVAALVVVHGSITDQHLNDSPIDLLDAEKIGIIGCGVAVVVAATLRFRWTRRHPKFRPPTRSFGPVHGTNRAVQSPSRDR
jgi:predicted ferric reductase